MCAGFIIRAVMAAHSETEHNRALPTVRFAIADPNRIDAIGL